MLNISKESFLIEFLAPDVKMCCFSLTFGRPTSKCVLLVNPFMGLGVSTGKNELNKTLYNCRLACDKWLGNQWKMVETKLAFYISLPLLLPSTLTGYFWSNIIAGENIKLIIQCLCTVLGSRNSPPLMSKLEIRACLFLFALTYNIQFYILADSSDSYNYILCFYWIFSRTTRGGTYPPQSVESSTKVLTLGGSNFF